MVSECMRLGGDHTAHCNGTMLRDTLKSMLARAKSLLKFRKLVTEYLALDLKLEVLLQNGKVKGQVLEDVSTMAS